MNTGNAKPAEKPAAPSQQKPGEKKKHDEAALDEALKESFPASDPVAVDIAKPVNKDS
ncbi:hypothetical protein ACO0LO_19360 [Undibacterium sp. TJN25]|uniref:hypothetical protein n=1 Tax=Undibacterium sp. TJN25 TaxID=3413056 RepID=UPI003BF0A74C